jgi:SAM-dependent methyltransferase
MHARLTGIIRRIYYRIPFRLRLWTGRIVFFPLDVRARRRGGSPRPPAIAKLVGQGDFSAIGKATVQQLIEHAHLRPEHAFLDVGCGIGRVALPLASYLLPSTPYAGFDIVPEFIDWCRENITPLHANFQFDLVDVANSEYNRGGEVDAASMRFRYPDASFDFSYAGSVYTHLLPPAAVNYIQETARVLKPGGILAATFFLLNDESLQLIDSGRAHMPLRRAGEGFRMLDPSNPEADVGLEERQVLTAFAEAGMEIEKVLYGSWCGRADAFSYQDLVIARKR